MPKTRRIAVLVKNFGMAAIGLDPLKAAGPLSTQFQPYGKEVDRPDSGRSDRDNPSIINIRATGGVARVKGVKNSARSALRLHLQIRRGVGPIAAI